MFSLSKRRFVQLAGLSIANRILPGWAQPPKRSDSHKVIIVTFGGGVRYAETFAPEGLRNIPRLVELRPQGYFFKTCLNAGVLSHFNSTASIVTGNWQRVDDFGFEPPAGPTLFEQFRKQTGAGPGNGLPATAGAGCAAFSKAAAASANLPSRSSAALSRSTRPHLNPAQWPSR